MSINSQTNQMPTISSPDVSLNSHLRELVQLHGLDSVVGSMACVLIEEGTTMAKNPETLHIAGLVRGAGGWLKDISDRTIAVTASRFK